MEEIRMDACMHAYVSACQVQLGGTSSSWKSFFMR
jgi:hypothetical protein